MTTIPLPATNDLIRVALDAAIRAPSPHNTQPWRFEVTGDRIDVLLDRERVLAVADRDGREARLSCGAAIFNMRAALSGNGHAAAVTLLPDRRRADLLATLSISGTHRTTPEDQALARAIGFRRSNRRPFTDRPVPVGTRQALVRAAAAEGAELVLLERPGDLDALAALLRHAEHLQSEDPAFQAEVRRWTVEDGVRDDGVPLSAGGPRPEPDSLLTLRHYGVRESGPARPFERTPLVAVLSSHTDTSLGQVRAGQAMQRVLLTATTAGLSASFLSQPVELESSRTALRRLLGGRGYPQTVLRLGYGFAAPATRRRAADTVTYHHDPGEARS
ncbi:Acg family FMN-binding oxidoreductase [Amycolatopsis anabasis]|uniref:Acg family FMN-binding oxidoreductase n=1 Tax=Amycolatopsis anabasis TaxID=1840409 RepID=UPI00131C61A8|nr:nitroreductase family protein [Amycolatopsis anabasis]